MNRPFSLSDEDYFKLETVRDSINLVQSLASETNADVAISPLLYASFLNVMRDSLEAVIQSACEPLINSPERLQKIKEAKERA